MKTRLSYVVAAMVLSGGISLAAAEALVRIFSSDAAPRYGVRPRDLYREDSLCGWRHRPNAEFLYRTREFTVRFHTNEEGYRSKDGFVTGSESDPVMAVFGDSLVQALQVDETDTYVKNSRKYP